MCIYNSGGEFVFCSNQEFLLCGDKRDIRALEKAIDLVCNGFNAQFRYYKIEEDGFLYFYKYLPNKLEGVIEIDKEDMNLEYLLNIVKLYLSSSKYRCTLKYKTINDCLEFDGSSYEGWEIVLDNKTFETKLIIKPFWCFYHK